jgi:hypothetical protein
MASILAETAGDFRTFAAPWVRRIPQTVALTASASVGVAAKALDICGVLVSQRTAAKKSNQQALF